MKEYCVPSGSGEAELTEKRSRFIGNVWRVTSEAEAKSRIEEIRKKHYSARHHCWCYILRDGPVRYSDDGEPQGTAGQPMLNVFERQNVTDVCCVVTRYFGGILLGTGGLARAYTQGAKSALDAAGISVVRRWTAAELLCTYAQYEGIRREVENSGGTVVDTEYGAQVTLSILLPQEKKEEISARVRDFSAGTVEMRETGEKFVAVPRPDSESGQEDE